MIITEEEGKQPQSTIHVEEIEIPDVVIAESKKHEESILVEEFPEVVTVTQVDTKEGPKKRVEKKKVLKKQKGNKQETTEIFTVEEEDKEPLISISVQEIEELPEEVQVVETLENGLPKRTVVKRRVIKKLRGGKKEATEIVTIEEEGKEPQSTVTIEEIDTSEKSPFEETAVVQIDEGDSKKRIVTKKIIKRKGRKQEATEIRTVEEEGKEPQTSVTVHETEISEEKIPSIIEELPEEVQVVETLEHGVPKKTTIRKRFITKRQKGKQESTEILTIEEEGKKPQSTVTIQEIEIPEEKVDTIPDLKEPEEGIIVNELPEELIVTQVETKEGPKKRVIKKKVIKKQDGNKQETTEIVTIEEEGKMPQTTVSIQELEEFPEEIQIVETSEHGIPKKTTIKKRVITKRKDGKQESAEILTIEEDGRKPLSTVTIHEIDIPEEKLEEMPEVKPKRRIPKQKLPEEATISKVESYMEELPEEIQIVHTVENKVPKKVTIKKRVLRKHKGAKQESTQIITVEEEGKEPQSTVTIEEIDLPEHVETKPKDTILVEELPDEVTVSEIYTKDGPKKRTTTKRTIRKQKGGKREDTEICTVEEEGKEPYSTVKIMKLEEPLLEEIKEVQKKVTGKKKPKRKEPKQDEPKLITDDNILFVPTLAEKKPNSEDIIDLVQIELLKKALALPTPATGGEEIEEFLPQYAEELPEYVQIIESQTKDGKPQEIVVKKRVIKKRKGRKEEVTEIRTVEKQGEKPEISVSVEEFDLKDDDIPEEISTVTIVEEVPEQIEIIEKTTEEGPKTVIIKRKVIKKRRGSKQENTEIITQEEEGKLPETSVIIEEIDVPVEELQISEPVYIEELPEEIKLIENITPEGTSRKKVKQRVIKKQRAGKQETTTIFTLQEEGKEPETSVTIEEIDIPTESIEQLPTKVPEEVIEELPTEIQIIEEKDKDARKFRYNEEIDDEDLDMDVPLKKKVYIEEIPEEVKIVEYIPKEGSPTKQIIKKRKINKIKGNKEESTEIMTVQEEGKIPKTTVVVEERVIPSDLVEDMPSTKGYSPVYIEELPEEIIITETKVHEGQPQKAIKKRTFKKPKGTTDEIIQIVTIEEEGKMPETSVVIEEIDSIHEKPKTKKVMKKKMREKPDHPEKTSESLFEKTPEEEKKKIKIIREISVLMPLERKEIKPQKIKIVDSKSLPTLKINFIDFPPQKEKETLPRISLLEPVYRENGVLSRNVEEAQKVPKTKKRRLKDKDLIPKDLEKLDLELEELKKNKLEKVDSDYKIEKKPKEKPMPDEIPKKIVTKKGKLPDEAEVEEQVKLKPVPMKSLKDEEGTKKLVAVRKESESEQTPEEKEKPEEKIEFLPYDIDRDVPSKLNYEPSVTEAVEDEASKPEKRRVPRSKKVKPAPETEEIAIVKGKPKPGTPDDDEDIKLKYKQKPKEDEKPEDITLKPFKKDKAETHLETTTEGKLVLAEIPSTAGDIEGDYELPKPSEREVTKKKIVKKNKRKSIPSEVTKDKIVEPEGGEFSMKMPEEEVLTQEAANIIEELAPVTAEISEEKPRKLNEGQKEITSVEIKKKIIRKKIPRGAATEIPEEKADKKPDEKPHEISEIATEEKPELMEAYEKPSTVQHALITPMDKPTKLSDIKLKKPKIPEKKESKGSKIPKFLLKSRISHLKFPPESESEKIPIMKDLPPVYRENGVLSRNVQEAEKIPKKKRVHVRHVEKELKELEKLDAELEELKKRELEKVDDEFKLSKLPKEKPKEIEDTKKIKIGKGKVPEDKREEELIKLKKVPEKKTDATEPEEFKVPKTIQPGDVMSRTEEEDSIDDIPFKSEEIDGRKSEKDIYLPCEVSEEEKPMEEKPKLDKPKKLKKKSEAETNETILEKGVGKPKKETDETKKGLKYKQKDKSEDIPEKIELKPFEKQEQDDVEVVGEEIVESHEAIGTDLQTDTTTTIKKVKKKIIKKTKPEKPSESPLKRDSIPGPEIPEETEPDETKSEVESVEDRKYLPKEIIEEPETGSQIKSPEVTQIPEDHGEKVTEREELSTTKKKVKKPKKVTPNDETIEISSKPTQKSIPINIKLVSVDKAQHLIITENKPEFAEIKLKKPKVTKKEIIPGTKVPKILLKSRINFNDFPPLTEKEQRAKITELEPVYRDNGILSRNVQEAENVKPKRKKIVKRIKELEKLDKELEDLKKAEPEKVDSEYRKRPEKPKKEKPILMKIVRVEVVAQKPKIIEIIPEKINLADIKLKTPKVKAKKEEGVKVPKMKLRSRIDHVDFPPLTEILQKLQITVLKTVKDNGVLSRNVEEAEKIKKIKRRKLKDDKLETPELEKLDLEIEQIERPKSGNTDDTSKFKRTPKEATLLENDDIVPIKLGKGKKPEKVEDNEESIKLKKIPQKSDEAKDDEKVKTKPKPEEETAIPSEKTVTERDDLKFEPHDIDRDELDKLEYSPPDEKEDDERDQTETKPKYVKKKKPKPSPEMEETLLVKNNPDITFRIPHKDKPEDEPEEIRLKPFKKSDENHVMKVRVEEIEKPTQTVIYIKPESEDEKEDIEPKEDIVKKTVKKKKISKKPHPDQKEKEIVIPPAEKSEPIPESMQEGEKPKDTVSVPVDILVPKEKDQKPSLIEKVNEVEDIPKTPESIPEATKLAETILKKPKKQQKPKSEIKIPKFKLKSRINYVDFPPITEKLQTHKITRLENKKDNGVISRNVKEAEKVMKTKRRKLKDVDKELQDLEKLDQDFEELKKIQPEKVDEAFKFERKPKQKPEDIDETTIPIRRGKGKVPEEEKKISSKRNNQKKP
ncbi:hypothetical protein JTB14_030232 [Gonioctena quinquepunctata]|nr:hypothetical protein JTB14_030232 [Gonioctena quinquepunctata]